MMVQLLYLHYHFHGKSGLGLFMYIASESLVHHSLFSLSFVLTAENSRRCLLPSQAYHQLLALKTVRF